MKVKSPLTHGVKKNGNTPYPKKEKEKEKEKEKKSMKKKVMK